MTKLENQIKNLNIKIESLEDSSAENMELKKQNIALTIETKRLEEVINSLRKCDQCDKQFDEKDSLKRHIHMKHNGKEFKCNNCEKHFKTNHSMQQHINSKHVLISNEIEVLRKEASLILNISEQRKKLHKTLYRMKQKEITMGSKCLCKGYCKINHSKHRYIQSKADKIFNKFASIIITDTEKSQSDIEHKCHKCDARFHYKSELRRHVDMNHKANKNYFCTECEESFENEEDLQCHVGIVHLTESNLTKSTLQCKNCDSEFDSAESLQFHIKTYHKSSPR